jgi:hypothetical protein
MQRLLGIVFIFTLLLTSVGLAGAQEPPINTPADNACNEGGLMAGKCNTEWEWVCGYYLARWVNAGGYSSTYAFPDWCAPSLLLPPRPPVIVTASASTSSSPAAPAFPSLGCVDFGPGGQVNFAGSYFLPAGSPRYNAFTACTAIGVFAPLPRIVYAPPPFDANALCGSAFGTTLFVPVGGGDMYICN